MSDCQVYLKYIDINSKIDKAPTSTSLHQGFRPPADVALQEWDKARVELTRKDGDSNHFFYSRS